MKSAWQTKVEEPSEGRGSDTAGLRIAGKEATAELNSQLEGAWSRKDDGKPLGNISDGLLTWDPAVMISAEPCIVQTPGQDLVKITIRDHDFYGRVFFTMSGDAAMICWTDGEIWQKVLSRNSGGKAQDAAFMPYQP